MGWITFDRGLAIGGFILAIVLVVLDKAGKLRGPVLFWLLALAAAMTLPLLFSFPWVSGQTGEALFARRALMVCLVGTVYSLLWVWIAEDSRQPPEPRATAIPTKQSAANSMPSLVFVFGAPLGDNDSAQWIMMLKHFGPRVAYNCDIRFYDDDRKNIEHEWLVKHSNSPFPPLGLAGESQKGIYLAEASPEGATPNFTWKPVNRNSQHYTVSISCRDGVFVEKWEIARVDGILRSKITLAHGPQWIKNNPSLEPVIFRYQDPEFVTTALAIEMPKSTTAKVVDPGWKPSHRFEVPAAIIDPNGNVQVLSGVKAPDGSTVTDFGSWNILTEHYGDSPEGSKPQ